MKKGKTWLAEMGVDLSWEAGGGSRRSGLPSLLQRFVARGSGTIGNNQTMGATDAGWADMMRASPQIDAESCRSFGHADTCCSTTFVVLLCLSRQPSLGIPSFWHALRHLFFALCVERQGCFWPSQLRMKPDNNFENSTRLQLLSIFCHSSLACNFDFIASAHCPCINEKALVRFVLSLSSRLANVFVLADCICFSTSDASTGRSSGNGMLHTSMFSASCQTSPPQSSALAT